MRPLFQQESLDDKLRAGHENAASSVDCIPEEQFLASKDDEIIQHLVTNWTVQPLTLHESEARLQKNETRIDVSGDRTRLLRETNEPFFVPGTEITIQIPFTGTVWIWDFRTNPYSIGRAPIGMVLPKDGGGVLVQAIKLPHDAPSERFKHAHEQNMREIRTCIERSKAQIEAYNNQLSLAVRDTVIARRARLKKHEDIATLLNIPLLEKADAPSVQKIPLTIKKPPPLPVPPKDGLKPEPGIDAVAYEKILNIIRHEGRSFETTPATFAKLDEEELRDVILAHLNGHGDALDGA